MAEGTKVYEWAFTFSLPVALRTAEGVAAFRAKQPQLQDLLRDLCKKFVYQLERTDGDNWHYQGYLNLKQKKKLSTLRNSFRAVAPTIHLSRSSEQGREALKDYCMKNESRVAGPWADKPIYRGQDLYADPYPWQKELQDMCLHSPAGDRAIHWIYDKAGNSGKTKWSKYMAYHHGAGVLQYSKTSDLINFVFKSDASIFIFDLTRAKPVDIGGGDLYAALEAIKNGMVFNSKYETGSKLFDPPHVIVFANNKPEQKNLSTDRWRFHSLGAGIMVDGLHDEVKVPDPIIPSSPSPRPSLVRHNAMNWDLDNYVPATPEAKEQEEEEFVPNSQASLQEQWERTMDEMHEDFIDGLD